MSEFQEVTDKVKTKKRFDSRDFNHIAEHIREVFEQRKRDRRDIEKSWEEVDRQLRMEPELSHKIQPGTNDIDPNLQWLAEVELPGQAQTLEVLTADSRRMKFPASGWWATAHANMTDEYLRRADFQSYISGDENDIPSKLNQDNADKIVEGVMQHWERQYDFRGNIDQIDGEAFKYGMGVGVARMVKKSVLGPRKGNASEKIEIPVLIPRSIKNTYLDDCPHAVMVEGYAIGPGTIYQKKQKLTDLKIAAFKGKTDPDLMEGGWMPKNVKNMDGGDEDEVTLLEYEGDLVVPRKTTGSIFLRNVIVTIAYAGGHDSATRERVVRLRFSPLSASTNILFPYNTEHIDNPYSSSPLMKGWPIQAAASQVLGRTLEVAALHAQPPISYDGDNPSFMQGGGPRVFPGAQWPSDGGVLPHIIGDPSAMFAVYAGLLTQYEGVSGVNQPRLGAQTVSHTTAFAKEAELSRGTVRTVDYVHSSLQGPMTQWLYVCYEMGKKDYKSTDFYLPSYKGWVSVPKKGLPDQVVFEAFGSGAPAEEQQKMQNRLNSLQMALQMEQLAVTMKQAEAALGTKSSIDIEKAIQEVLREGGWTDIDAILRSQTVSTRAPARPPVAGNPQASGVGVTAPGTALEALQNAVGR